MAGGKPNGNSSPWLLVKTHFRPGWKWSWQACSQEPQGAGVELLESRQPSLPGDGPSGCALISQAEVQMLFERWNKALQSRDPERIAHLYSRDAVLLPTLSDEPRTDHDSIVDYFSHFLQKRPNGEISQREILIGCNMVQDAGLYNFRFLDGSNAQARYSFIYVLEDGVWKISHHHSSLLPEATRT